MADTFAILRSSGKTPYFRLRLIKCVTTLDIIGADNFRSLGPIVSLPADLLGLRVFRNLKTSKELSRFILFYAPNLEAIF